MVCVIYARAKLPSDMFDRGWPNKSYVRDVMCAINWPSHRRVQMEAKAHRRSSEMGKPMPGKSDAGWRQLGTE